MMMMELLLMVALCTAILLYPLDAMVLPLGIRSNDNGDCFEIYVDSVASIGENYTKNYMNCQEGVTGSAMMGGVIETENRPERAEIQAEASRICERLKACENMENQFDFFECHSNMGLTNTQSVMLIHLNSTKVLVDLQQEQELAEKLRMQCEIDAQYNYKEQTALAYLELTHCLSQDN